MTIMIITDGINGAEHLVKQVSTLDTHHPELLSCTELEICMCKH